MVERPLIRRDETLPLAADMCLAIHSLTKGRGVDLVFETSGVPEAQSNAVDVVCSRGKVAFVGINKRGDKSIAPEQFVHKQAMLFGSKVMPSNLYAEMTRFMLDKDVRFEAMVTHHSALEDGPTAFAKFDAGAAGKFVFDLDL